MRAELLEDAGAAAADDEFFRSLQFLAAEGVTHTLRIERDGAALLAPLVVRGIDGTEERDASSPYGYPGFAPATDGAGEDDLPLDPGRIDWEGTGLVSIFLRHRLGSPPPLTATPRGAVQIADPALPRKSRMSDRQQIRKNLRRGYEVRSRPGPDACPGERQEFLGAYEETMRRAGAAQRYFFAAPYFERILSSPRTWLFSAVEPDGAVAAASIVAESDGMLHYYLSGTADAQLGDSPMKNVVAAIGDFAEQRGVPLNLGGGVTPGDALEEFKRGFANREERFLTSEIVCHEEAYRRLSAGRGESRFFPAYRAPD